MATFFFIGGEDHDFTKIGATSVDTATTAARRTANARCSLKVGTGAAATDGYTGTLSAAQSTFWLTARYYGSGSIFSSYEVLSLTDSSGVRRVVLRTQAGGSNWQLIKKNAAGTVTVLATSGVSVTTGSLSKLDVSISYGTSGTLSFYVDGTLVISYTGDLTTDGTTSLTGFVLGSITNGTGTYWSEVICSDADTRFMDLITLAPAANGNTFNFDTGSVASINETTLDDATTITSGTVGQIAQFTVGSSGVTGSKAIKAVAISARAGKGATGPQTAKMNVRTGSADYSSSSIALQAGSVARIQGVFTTNPGTGNAWTNAELTAAGFNIGIVSDT